MCMQAYVEAEGDCEERGISHLPVHEVHKIALLDMRLGNCDRNGGEPLSQTTPVLMGSGHATSASEQCLYDTCIEQITLVRAQPLCG